MEQKFSPKSKVGSIAEVSEFKAVSKREYAKYNDLCAKLDSLTGNTVTETGNQIKVDVEYSRLASKQAKEKIKTFVIISSVIAAVIYTIVFIIALIKADYLSEKIFAVVLLGLLIGLLLNIVINLIKGAFEEMYMDEFRETKEYVKAIEEAREKDRQVTLERQKTLDSQLASIEAQKEDLMCRYGELINGWERTIAKAKFETILIGFAQGLSEEEIFEKLLFYVPLNANTYGEAMQVAFNRLRSDWLDGKAALDRCYAMIDSTK